MKSSRTHFRELNKLVLTRLRESISRAGTPEYLEDSPHTCLHG